MNSVDMQGAFHNLTQMDRHQQDAHRMPVSHQDQNANAHQQEASQRIDMATQSDEAENKTLDSEARKKEDKKKRRGRENDRGFFIDFSA
jgi:hypothetical protein